MQPKPTSAHRTPSVHIPEDLNSCTHVFVLRGGVQPTLTTPYDGPYRVLDRTPEGFRIDFPGRPSDIVALARLRPAIMSQPEDQEPAQDHHQELDDAAPPSPPPPGRRPGPRTRMPETTDRVTRSTASRQTVVHEPLANENEPILHGSPEITTSPAAVPPPEPQGPPDESAAGDTNEALPSARERPPTAPQSIPPVSVPASAPARTFTSRQERLFSNRGGPVPALPQAQRPQQQMAETRGQGGVPSRNRVLSFSKPRQGDFSYRRKKPDIAALNAILQAHLA